MATTDPRRDVTKRSITVAGHRTSVSLEPPFLSALSDIAAEQKIGMSALVTAIDSRRPAGVSLSAAIRVHVLDWYRDRTARR